MRYWLALFTLSALLLGAPATAQTPAAVNGCVYISGGITLSNGQRTAFQCDVNGKLLTTGGATGTGTVTSVAQTFTGGIVSVAGSPITTSGTFALTVAGTSGGIPYFSSGTTWASSAALAANSLVIGGGAGAAPASPAATACRRR